jgi:diguanylate cyclase (GGDEF)-like protein/PAS domain S-box-containing protein
VQAAKPAGTLGATGEWGAVGPAPALARSFDGLTSAFRAAPVGAGIWSVDGELLWANPVLLDLIQPEVPSAQGGPTPVAGRRFESFTDPSHAVSLRAELAEVLSGVRNYLECDFRCHRPDGQRHWVRTMVTPVYGPQGRPDFLLSQIFDFANPRTRMVTANRLVNEAPVLLWLTDLNGTPCVGNRASYKFLGVKPDESQVGMAVLERFHPDDLGEIGEELANSIRDRAPVEFTARIARSDGEYRWLHHRAMPFFDADGAFEGYAGASLDVTEAEELRLELDNARALFRTVTEAGPIAVLRTDSEGRIVYAEGVWPVSLDRPAEDMVGLEWQSLLVDEYVDEILTKGLAAIASREPYAVRARIRDHGPDRDGLRDRAAGSTWAEVRVAPVFGPGDVHDGFVATLADVSAEVAAGARADQLARVLDAGSDFLMIADHEGLVSYVNDAAYQHLGVRGSESKNPPSALVNVLEDESRELFRTVVEPALASLGIWRGELTFRSRLGQPIPASALFIAHQNHLGRIESVSLVARDITDLKDAERLLRQLATHDYLTGLPNRVLLYDRLEQAVARFNRHGQPVALLYLDLDRFKPVNDDLGHHIGDSVLREIADRIHTAIRDTDTAARIGGDEFAVLVEGMEEAVQLRVVADRLIEAISQPVVVGEHIISVGVSIGLVVAGTSADAADSLMAAADAAMYRAKAAGRGCYEFVGPGGDPI